MSRLDEQLAFWRDVHKLLECIWAKGYETKITYSLRSPEEQARLKDLGKSKTLDSGHVKNLAIDLYLFKDIDADPQLEFIETLKDYDTFGVYWKSLNPKNVWGGDWPGLRDAGHFERKE